MGKLKPIKKGEVSMYYMKKADKPEQVERMKQHYADTAIAKEGKKQGSTGWKADIMEGVIRDMTMAKGITTVDNLYVRKAGKDDLKVKLKDGTYAVIEIKHGGGSLAYAENAGLPEFPTTDRSYCLNGVDWVIYHRTADPNMKRTKIAREYMVARAEDFMDMLEEYCHGPKAQGWSTAVKFNNATHTAINIQWSYLDQFWAGLQNDDRAMCLWDWSYEVLGRDLRWDW